MAKCFFKPPICQYVAVAGGGVHIMLCTPFRMLFAKLFLVVYYLFNSQYVI